MTSQMDPMRSPRLQFETTTTNRLVLIFLWIPRACFQEISTIFHLDKDSEEKVQTNEKSNPDSILTVLAEFVSELLCDLTAANWYQRHGASMAMDQIVTHALPL